MSTMNMRLRQMQLSDLTQVMEIECEQFFPWSTSQLQECLSSGYQCIVLEIEQQLIGFAVLLIAADEAEILNIVIKNSVRGHGYGKLLLNYLITIAKEQKVKTVFLEVRRSNLPALKLYQQIGFKQIGTRKDYYPAKQGREDAIILQRDIL